jgi:hypothetical protein
MDQKTSLLINRQVPEFVRDEYPLFLSFLEAYYEFLENKQGTKNNDLTTKLKSLKDITDVDVSIDEFETQFLNTFASLMPVDAEVDKSFLLKNILPLYQSKGSENSFKFLFRLLFSKEPELKYPKDNILRLSTGNWKTENTLKVSTTDISSYYVGDGVKTEYRLISPESSADLEIYVNNVLVTTGFKVLKEYQLLVFNSPVALNSTISVFYTTVDRNLFANRQITGVTTGSTVVTEKVFSSIINNENIFEIYVDAKTLVGEFQIGESVTTNVFIGDDLVNVRMKTLSKIDNITVTNSGSDYNVGDPVIILSSGAERQPIAFVTSVFTSSFDDVNIVKTGAGFQVGSNVTIEGFVAPFVDIEVNSVFLNSSNTSNTFRVFSDIVSDINPANTAINAASYGLSGVLSGNINTVISHCFSNTTFANIGEIIGIQVNAVDASFNFVPLLEAEPAKVLVTNTGSTLSNTVLFIDDYGSLGKTSINDPGENYAVGDELIFTNQPGYFGVGATAEVREVGANGEILVVKFVPSKITGLANTFSSNVNVIGTGTFFETELRVGDQIWINDEDRTVVQIISNTSINVNSTFSTSANGQKIRLYGKTLVGGANYEQDHLPSVTVSSVSGNGANISVVCIMGSGEEFAAVLGNNKPGGIETISIIDAGKALLSLPDVDLTQAGDGLATAEVSLVPSFEVLDGKWIGSTGLLSDRNMKIQGLDYYIDYSYVLASTVEFKRYKNIFKQLLHPGGTKGYAELNSLDEISATQVTVLSELLQEPV